MTLLQEQAIRLIQQLPDNKIQAIITLISDEINFTDMETESLSDKRQAFEFLNSLSLNLPENFDADEELRKALEDRYGCIG